MCKMFVASHRKKKPPVPKNPRTKTEKKGPLIEGNIWPQKNINSRI